MLRKDTIHMIKTEWEPMVPEIEEVKVQMNKRQTSSAGSVRAALGKVIDASKDRISPSRLYK